MNTHRSWKLLAALLAYAAAVAALAAVAFVSCTDPNPDAFSGATSAQTGSGVYPHADNYADPGQHGKYVIQNGYVECQGCHGEDFKGGSSGVSCFSCHALYPHPSNFADGSQHGPKYLANPDSCATRCHGADLAGGDSGVSCSKCHAGVTEHPEGWEQIQQHGVYVDQHGGPSTCANQCHGTDWKGGSSGVSCFGCHSVYPHTWSSHGQYVLQHSLSSCQTQCHGTNLQGGYSGVSCFQCHEELGDDDKDATFQ